MCSCHSIPECCVMFSGVKLSMGSFLLLLSGVGKCSCSKTLDFISERDMKMKLQMHLKFCSNPPVGFDKIKVPKKLQQGENNSLMSMKG